MSPLEFAREIEAHDAARKDEYELAERRVVATAWHAAAFYAELTSTGKLPSLGDALERLAPKVAKPQGPPPSHGAMVQTLSAIFGMPGRPMSEDTRRALRPVNGHA